jgi:hypothetical protein
VLSSWDISQRLFFPHSSSLQL